MTARWDQWVLSDDLNDAYDTDDVIRDLTDEVTE